MNGFEYQYHTPDNILNNVLFMGDISPIHLGVFGMSLFLYFILVFYIIPTINILIINTIKNHASKKRKKFIKQIVIQKDIEDQISEEIDTN